MYNFILIFLLLQQPAPLTVVSPDFANDGLIPARLTCDGENINPNIIINGIPEGTQSMALIVESTDATLKSVTHWVVWNIKPTETIFENTVPGVQGVNSKGKRRYQAPCPTTVSERYVFRIYALNKMLSLSAKSSRKQVEAAMAGHITGTGQLTGEYSRDVVTAGSSK